MKQITTPVSGDEIVSENPDDQAMLSIAAGDGGALKVLFDRWRLPVINFLYRSLGSHADAEDIALEVFTEVWRAAPRYRPQGTFSAWLFAIARGKMRHELRRRRRKPVVSAPLEFLEAPGNDVRNASELAEREQLLLESLAQLPEPQRSALLFSVQTPMTPAEIAAALGVKKSHVYVLIHRGRCQLKKLMEKRS
jgi:RNA polymerase sigma-70 factor, ECF subfamily